MHGPLPQAIRGSGKDRCERFVPALGLGPPGSCPFSLFFGWEGSPTKIDYKKKSGTQKKVDKLRGIQKSGEALHKFILSSQIGPRGLELVVGTKLSNSELGVFEGAWSYQEFWKEMVDLWAFTF